MKAALTDSSGTVPRHPVLPNPTGTSDEHLSLVEHMAPVRARLSAVLVTTPQAVALLDALKCLSFARATGLRVLGVVENMSGFVCPCCGERSGVFSTGGGGAMAAREGVPFLGSLPIDTELVSLLDAAEPAAEDPAAGGDDGGRPFALWARYEKTATAPLFKQVVDKVLGALADSSGGTEGAVAAAATGHAAGSQTSTGS